MTKTVHTATHNGQTFTRTSKSRVYTHTVVARRSYETALHYAKQDNCDESNFSFYTRVAEGRTNGYGLTKEQAIEKLEGARDAGAYCGIQIVKRIAAIEARKAAGEFDRFDDLGWCGRLDLAQKLASKAQTNPTWNEVVVLEAVVA